VTDASGVTSYSYDPVGNLAGYSYPNGVSTSYAYDPLNRLTQMQSTCATGTGCGPANTTIASYAYTLGSTGNRLSVAELSGRSVTYGYDDLYRLTGESITCGTAAPGCVSGNVNYTFDNVGNRKQLNSTLPAIAATGLLNYDANDRTSTDPYDANGNLLNGGVGANVYDFENRLVQAGGVKIVYDGDGNRVRETVATTTTSYLVADQNLTGYAQVLDEVQGGAVSRTYSYGLSLVSQKLTASGSLRFYGFDGHGSVRYLTSSIGAITDTYDYDAFGNLISATGTTPNNYLFAGEQFDPALGVYYNRARYYDQRQGRFWSMDTWEGDPESPQSLHKYFFANGSPVNATDPSGYITDLVLAALYGQRVHELIGDHFEITTGGISNRSINTIIGVRNYLRPDLVNVLTGEVYEIKPTASFAEGVLQLTVYLGILNILDPEKRRWVPGFSYFPPPLLRLTNLTVALVQVPIVGVITYQVRNLAIDVLTLAFVTSAVTAEMRLSIGTATLTAQYGY